MAKSKSNTSSKTKAKDKAKATSKKKEAPKKVAQSVEKVEQAATQGESKSTGKRGRPTVYTPELGGKICDMIADGWTLRQICREEGMPPESTVRGWAIDPNHPFSAQYTRAREVGLWRMVDDILEIADDGTNDWVERETKDGGTALLVDHEHVTRSRLRVDTRKWLLSKLLPQFADRLPAGDKPADNKPPENQLPPDAPRPAEPDHLVHLGSRYASHRPVEGSLARH